MHGEAAKFIGSREVAARRGELGALCLRAGDAATDDGLPSQLRTRRLCQSDEALRPIHARVRRHDARVVRIPRLVVIIII